MKILYLTGGCFPYGSAYASRTLNLCKAIKFKGHEVTVIADYNENQDKAEGCENGIYYYLADFKKEFGHSNRVNKYLHFVENYLHTNCVDVIICASDHDRFERLYKIIKSHNVPIILESCEWFGRYNWRYGLINPGYYRFRRCWKKYYPKVDGVIAISSLLQQHYSDTVKNVVCIPTVLDASALNCSNKTVSDTVRLIYAGSAGKSKDLLKNLILALQRCNELKVRFVLHIYGISKAVCEAQMGKHKDVLKMCEQFVVIHGRVPQSEINRCYCESDYSVLFRPKRRSSNAGFPTKLAESMMAGTPVICNYTGDISLYVKDEVNGFVVADTGVDEICKCLERIYRISSDKYCRVRMNAKQTADESFSYLRYSDVLDNLLNEIIGDIK